MTNEARYQERCIEKLGFPFTGDEVLLDVGCGDGDVARLLRRRVREVLAIDVQPSSSWRDEDGLRFEIADGERLPYADETFDVVHAKDALHHMADPASALAEIRRVLKTGGAALLIEANRFNPSFYIQMTRIRGHEHFSRRRFRDLVGGEFPAARFGAFEAHYVPGAGALAPLQRALEDALERLRPLHPLLAYNFAVARR